MAIHILDVLCVCAKLVLSYRFLRGDSVILVLLS